MAAVVVEEPHGDAHREPHRGHIASWGGAAAAVTVFMVMAAAWWTPVTTSHDLVDSVGYGPQVLHAADAGVATGVHAVSISSFGKGCYGAAGLAFAAGVLPQAAAALLPTLGAALRSAKRAMRRAPPMAPWLMVSVLLYVLSGRRTVHRMRESAELRAVACLNARCNMAGSCGNMAFLRRTYLRLTWVCLWHWRRCCGRWTRRPR